MRAVLLIAVLFVLAQLLEHYMPEPKVTFLMRFVFLPLVLLAVAGWESWEAWKRKRSRAGTTKQDK
jgi:hypothetical protein